MCPGNHFYDIFVFGSLRFVDCGAECKRHMAHVVLIVFNPGPVSVPFNVGKIIELVRVLRRFSSRYLPNIPNFPVFRPGFGVFQFHNLISLAEDCFSYPDFHLSRYRRVDTGLKLGIEPVHADKGVVSLRVQKDHFLVTVCTDASDVHPACGFKDFLFVQAFDEPELLSEDERIISLIDFMGVCDNRVLPCLPENLGQPGGWHDF